MTAFYRQDTALTPDGAQVWFEQQGEGGPGAVLCDGLGCDGFIWKALKPLLGARRRVLHWNYRGHGKSGVPTDDRRIGMEFLIEDLAQLMEATAQGPSVIFGHSMGVQVALEFQRRHPDKVVGLVLLCGSYGNPLDTWHDHTLLRWAFPALLQAVERAPKLAKGVVSRVVLTEAAMQLALRTELNRHLLAREDFWPYLRHLAHMDPLYFVRTLDSLKDHSAWEHLPFVSVPTLVVGGEIDRFTPVWLSKRMAEHIPQSEYLLVPQGSHTAPLERPGLVNRAVEDFLREKVDRPARERRVG